MPYPAAAVANELLDLADEAGKSLTQIDIQKLVYFAHGWQLGIAGTNLIDETFLAWKYGPVVRSLYDRFRSFGSDPITSRVSEWEIDDDNKFVLLTAQLDSGNSDQDSHAKAMVRAVWERYGTLSPFKLVEITHLPGSPWAEAYKNGERYIENEKIREYFAEMARASSAA